MTKFEYEPIWNQDAEMACIGSIILSEKAYFQVAWLKREMFYQPAHRIVYDAVESLYKSASAIDLVTIKDWLGSRDLLRDAGGVEYVTQMCERVATAVNARYYAEIVREKWVLRELEARLGKCTLSLRDAAVRPAQALEMASTLVQGLLDSTTCEYSVADEVFRLSNKTKPGLATGIYAIDEYSNVGGLYPDEPNMVCALTGVGKSVIGLQLVKKWCMEGRRGVFVSLELKAEKVIRRLMKMLCGFGDYDSAQRAGAGAEWDAAQREMSGWDLMVYDPSKTRGFTKNVEDVCEWVTAKHESNPLEFSVMDYAQFFRSRERIMGGKTQLMEHVEDELRMLNARCGFVMVVLAQLIRLGERDDKRLQIRNSQEFGLGAAFDLRLIGNEKDGYTLKCEKNRSGRNLWEHKLRFNKTYLTFESDPVGAMK